MAPKAGSVVADARLLDRTSSDGIEFEVTGPQGGATRLRGLKTGTGPVVLFPVPKGQWKLRASHKGHRDSERSVVIEADEDELLRAAFSAHPVQGAHRRQRLRCAPGGHMVGRIQTRTMAFAAIALFSARTLAQEYEAGNPIGASGQARIGVVSGVQYEAGLPMGHDELESASLRIGSAPYDDPSYSFDDPPATPANGIAERGSTSACTCT